MKKTWASSAAIEESGFCFHIVMLVLASTKSSFFCISWTEEEQDLTTSRV